MTMPLMPERAHAVINMVAERHKLPPAVLLGKSRLRPDVLARHEAMARLRELDPVVYSFWRLANIFKCNVTTVRDGIMKHRERNPMNDFRQRLSAFIALEIKNGEKPSAILAAMHSERDRLMLEWQAGLLDNPDSLETK